jgi:transposase
LTKGACFMLEIAGEEAQSMVMDHHGLVAAVCRDLGIAEKIDQRLDKDPQRVVSPGQAVVAMILNGLGFTNRRLYLTHQFFQTKPVEHLLGAPIKAEDLTDYTLGHTLDQISKYGASELFASVAFETAMEQDLLGMINHLDSTSFSVHGNYEVQDDPSVIEITHGHSKDHRPDLKQVVLSLVANGPSAMPIFMEPLDGNSSDKESFHETIKKMQAFQKQIHFEKDFKWVADSALYAADKLLKSDYQWLTRVPETIKEARSLVEKSDETIAWKESSKGYKMAFFESSYGDVAQRWLLVFSEQAYQREKKTFDKGLKSEASALTKALWHLGNTVFGCETDALSALKVIVKKYHFHEIAYKIVAVLKNKGPGRPKIGEEKKKVVGYKVEASFAENRTAIERRLNRKGRFILATNDLNAQQYPDSQMLLEYKEQQKVERGFRFLKDPWFMVDSIFLKLPRRVEALMMIMTLCLMVYNIAQYRLREALKAENETLPNQLGKPIQNPTLRWIFQIMEGISLVQFYEKHIEKPVKEVIMNLNALRQKIIRFFGETACLLYGLIAKNPVRGLGM